MAQWSIPSYDLLKNMPSLQIQNNLVICGDDKLKLFISHLDHTAILAKAGMDVGL